jgi:hypothetical protein
MWILFLFQCRQFIILNFHDFHDCQFQDFEIFFIFVVVIIFRVLIFRIFIFRIFIFRIIIFRVIFFRVILRFFVIIKVLIILDFLDRRFFIFIRRIENYSFETFVVWFRTRWSFLFFSKFNCFVFIDIYKIFNNDN